MIIFFIFVSSSALRCCSEFVFNQNDDFQMDTFTFKKGAQNSVQDSIAQSDNALSVDKYARGAHSRTLSRANSINKDVALGHSKDSQAAQFDQGIFNYSMDRTVGQHALSQHMRGDSGKTIQSQLDKSQIDAGAQAENAFLIETDRRQYLGDFDRSGQAFSGHNTSQTVVDRGVANAESKHEVGISPSVAKGSFTANSAKTQDYASILDTDKMLDAERNMLDIRHADNWQRNLKKRKENSDTAFDGARAQDLSEADGRNVQYFKLEQVAQERNNLIDASGTKDLRFQWEKGQSQGDVSIGSDGSESGRFSLADFKGFDEAKADGETKHVSSKFAVVDQEVMDDRGHRSSSLSTMTVVRDDVE